MKTYKLPIYLRPVVGLILSLLFLLFLVVTGIFLLAVYACLIVVALLIPFAVMFCPKITIEPSGKVRIHK